MSIQCQCLLSLSRALILCFRKTFSDSVFYRLHFFKQYLCFQRFNNPFQHTYVPIRKTFIKSSEDFPIAEKSDKIEEIEIINIKIGKR